MRKIFTASFLALYIFCSCAFADVNPDTEIHRVIGGLCSVVSALSLSGEAEPSLRILREYFDDAPADWNVRFERVSNDIWVGVPVGKFSTARKYLRSNSPELGITDSPAGGAWMGGNYAWLKAGTVRDGRLIPAALKAAQGSGNDSDAIFFSTDDSNWWQSYPSLTRRASQEVLKLCGAKVPGLRRPAGISQSIYEEVKPSEVRKPADIHTNRKHEFGESYDIDMGDVIFRPIPNTHYRY